MIGGVVLAAGASSRMGRPKALLPCGDGVFVERLVAALLEGGVDLVTVVVGEAAPAVEDLAARVRLPARLVRNLAPERGQLSSLHAAIDALADCPLDAIVVIPVDLPLVSTATVRRVLDAWRRSGAAVARPVRNDGRHGHPVVFASRLVVELRASDVHAGARPVIARHMAEVLDVPVDDDGAFEDIDTPADYERLIGPLP